MGFYVRKSVRAGPFRFNLSKSGVGVSAGVPGFRVGTGPRGNYVHAGRHGVYYRSTLGGGRKSGPQPDPGYMPQELGFSPSDVVLHEVTGTTALNLVPTGAGDLVDQLSSAGRAHWRAPWVAAPVVLAALMNPIVGAVALVLAIPVFVWLLLRDRARRSVVAFYDVRDDIEEWFEGLVDQFESLRACQRVWRVNAAGRVTTTHQFKVNSGASTIVSRSGASVSMEPPAHLKTNIAVPTISSDGESLHFLPDRILVRLGRQYSDISYSALEAAAYTQRFIESESPPADSEVVDTTWQYVNKSGGPDRRFNNNRQLPIMLYGRLELATPQGFFWILDISRADVASPLAESLASAPASLETMTDARPSATPNCEQLLLEPEVEGPAVM